MRNPLDITTKEIKELLDNPLLCGNCRKALEAEYDTRIDKNADETHVNMKVTEEKVGKEIQEDLFDDEAKDKNRGRDVEDEKEPLDEGRDVEDENEEN